MERAAPITFDQNEVAKFKLALYMPPHKDYRVRVATFPASNANKAWEEEGIFFTTSDVYIEGKHVGAIHTECVTQEGYVSIDLSDISSLVDPEQEALVVVSMHSNCKIPLETYAAYHHIETGGYISFPVGMFIGDRIYTFSHADRLENAMFWPGLVINESSESCLVITNPFDVNFNYQLSLYTPGGKMQQSDVFRLKRHTFKIHVIEEDFPEHLKGSNIPGEQFAVCVSAQYKILSYFGIRDRKGQFFTTLDHLHPFIME